MTTRPTWYPNADEQRCSGSFQIAITYPDRDGNVQCAVCGRLVGMRNPRIHQIAAHRIPYKTQEAQQ